LSRQGLQAAPQRRARPASVSFLQLMSEGSNDQIATEACRRVGAMHLPPGQPEIARRPIDQFGNFDFNLPAQLS